MFVANIGDAKAVVARSSVADGSENKINPLKAIVLTREHKAIFPQERARIQKVSYCANGTLFYFILYGYIPDFSFSVVNIDICHYLVMLLILC